MSEPLPADVVTWLEKVARLFYRRRRRKSGTAPVTVRDLVHTGYLEALRLVKRYDESLGQTFTGFCGLYVNNVFARLWDKAGCDEPGKFVHGVLGTLRYRGPRQGDDEEQRMALGDHMQLLAMTHYMGMVGAATATAAAGELEAWQDSKRLYGLIDQLPPPKDALMRGVYRDGLYLTEVAEELGVPYGHALELRDQAIEELGAQLCETRVS